MRARRASQARHREHLMIRQYDGGIAVRWLCLANRILRRRADTAFDNKINNEIYGSDSVRSGGQLLPWNCLYSGVILIELFAKFTQVDVMETIDKLIKTDLINE